MQDIILACPTHPFALQRDALLADLCKKFPKLVLVNFTADPEIGRFISQDTYRGELDDPGQWHLYAYCANNPINYTDPSGYLYATFNRSQAQDQYNALQNAYIVYQLWSAVNFYKRAVKKAVIEIFEDILKDQALSIMWDYTIGAIFDKYKQGFYKGGYKKHKVYKNKTVTRHKRKYKTKYTSYEKITKTILTGSVIKPKFEFKSKNKTTYMYHD